MAVVASDPRASAGDRRAAVEARLGRVAAPALVVLALALGLAARFAATGPLWLDEALTVSFSRLPLTEIPGALRHDGAPPLFYLVLHLWMRVAGDSTLAVRLPALAFGLATIPVVAQVARRLAPEGLGRVAAGATVVIMAANPFAIRYASEARMYSLVSLLAALGLLLALRAFERPTPLRLLPLGLTAAALLYTHYWGIHLLVATGSVLLVRALRRRRRPAELRAHLLVLGALVVGSLLWLPWVPTFLFQAERTGTPWATPAGVAAIIDVAAEYTGGLTQGSRLLSYLLSTLGFLGVVGRARVGGRVEVDLTGSGPGRPILAVMGATLLIAIGLGALGGAAFVGRYTSVVFPLAIVLAGLGVASLGTRRARAVVLLAIVVLGATTAVPQQLRPRTQAGLHADRILASAVPGDVVGFCPDQVGVAVDRLLEGRFEERAFPRGTGPFVDWVDYADVNDDASPAAFALELDRLAGPERTVWLVSSREYRTSARSCGEVELQLRAARPAGRMVSPAQRRFWERGALFAYPPGPAVGA